MSDLIPPHGGLSSTICRTVPKEEREEFSSQAAKLKKLPVSAADLSTVYRIADGTLSPLTGPMTKEVYQRVLDEQVIEQDGKLYAWTIPLSFPISHELASQLSEGETVALTSPTEEVVGTLEVQSIFEWDKAAYIKGVYGTERTDHPGADMVLKNEPDASCTHLVGGELRALPQPGNPSFGKYVLTPRDVRSLNRDKGWDAVVAFQTRNPLHRAHEYALVYALEELIRAGKNAGAALNPLVGETKGDDVSAEIRMQTYEKLISDRGLGER